ncbi:UDP-N-acetylglucosamine/UDP-N-acetylgalactosaminediphosphorylase [Eubacterium uniforme]|uniref:UDP-N-acetylglucosamine/UDP-N-acetylgalactosamine diphosphorylase n=1 Tax=Eubacterium uniforme TaxID=39495 RepID=A0A1T4V4P7_9FIRM|nr:UTP--glucose-1-phosphate uridylyltransferase [Eubacterium uniforme]SKA59883.1 UDP-N-acetylglucosamine/UDP-N-acetylgalactosaminediphosphorylase [Eubacterium uniforme]
MEKIKEILEKNNQEQLLKFVDELSDNEKNELLQQISEIDFSLLDLLKDENKQAKKGVITPILDVARLTDIEANSDKYKEAGLEIIRQGKAAAVLLAGGMGTRLGSDKPKGMYNIGITKDVYIFEMIIRNLLDVVKEAGNYIHLFVMTSEKNHEDTTGFFAEKNYFGYDKNFIHFFKQSMAPATDYDGKILLETKGRVATSPNGNGGWFKSMEDGNVMHIVDDEGIEWLNVFAVDNVCQRICDPKFIGATYLSGKPCGAKVVAKASPDEKVGVLCNEDGRPSIVEYYELTKEMMEEKDKDGNYAYNYGVILNYLLKVSDLKAIINDKLPVHIVEKKIKYVDDNGNEVSPETPNGYKFETLILDMIHMLDGCLGYEVLRDYEFAPIKNKTGVDSVESARELLKKNGVSL